MSFKRSVFIVCLYFVSALSCGPNQVSVDNTCWCTSGYYCPSNIGTAIACPPGYTSNLGAQSDYECYVARGVILNVTIDYASMNTTETAFLRALPAGVGVITYEDELMIYVSNCPPGYWCPEASVVPVACVAGTYQPDNGADSINDCLPCPLGKYCAAGTSIPSNCLAGTFRDTVGGVPGSCSTCLAGGYCPAGSSSVTPSPAGFYIPITGAPQLSSAIACPAGAYCALGSSQPVQCPSGTYNTLPEAVNITSCINCIVGYYCLQGSATPTSCPAGTFNPTVAAESSTNCTACIPGHYCPQSSFTTIPCLAGKYSSVESATSILTCQPCPKGYFCTLGSSQPEACVAGTYQWDFEGTSTLACTQCPPGFFCPSASIEPVACLPGTHRDDQGATQQQDCLLCLPGTHSLDIARSSDCPPCPANYYCPTSTTLLTCPPHTLSDPGIYSVLSCTCETGYDCVKTKQINAVIRLNSSLTDFNNDESGVRTKFISDVANAARVTVDRVTINAVSEARRLRRLLTHHELVTHSKDKLAASLRVQSSLKQAIHIKDLKHRFNEKLLSPPPKKQTTQLRVQVRGVLRKP